MGLESGDFLDDLNSANPLGTDVKSQGDDHIRLVKKVLLASFPDVAQAVSTVISSTIEPVLFRKSTIWFDETLNLMKVRNKGDSAWITMALSPVTSNSVDIDAGTIDGVTITGGTINSTPIEGGTIGATTPVTALDVDNININGNTISSTNTNGDIVLDPDGTGDVSIPANLDVTAGNITLSGTVDGVDIAALDTAVTKNADFNAHTILQATTDDTPVAITVAEERLVGRITSGNITALTEAEVRAFLDIAPGTTTIEDGATLDAKASAAEMETATDDAKFVTPLRANDHPSACKAWVNFTGTGTVTINDDFNVSTVTDDGATGLYAVNFVTSFSSANYGAAGIAIRNNGGSFVVSAKNGDLPTTGAFPCQTFNDAGGAEDGLRVFLSFFGDQ